MSNPKSKSLTFGDFISDVDKPYFIDRLLEEHKQVLETGVPLTRGTYTYAGPEKRPVFKHSRVELSGEDSTIINASYIRGFERPKAYIATETPQSAKGAQAFWETVWQHRTKVIVMLNKPEKEERGYCYWGPGAGLSLQFGKLKVSTVEIEALLPTLEITKLEVSNEKGDSLTVYHFLYFKWPVHCELPPTYDFLRFLFTVRKRIEEVERSKGYFRKMSPILVHCSDGLERTMIFCTIDVSISEYFKTQKVKIFPTVLRFREERLKCLSTKRNFFFCYYTLHNYFVNGSSAL